MKSVADSSKAPKSGPSISRKIRQFHTGSLALLFQDTTNTRLWLGVVNGEHAFNKIGNHLWVQVLHAIGQHQMWGVPQFLVVLEHKGVLEPFAVSSEARCVAVS
jgi:hypothetical protein